MKPIESTGVDMSRARTLMWVGQLPPDLYESWMRADGDKKLGKLEIISFPQTGSNTGAPEAAMAAAEVDKDKDNEDKPGIGKIETYDENGKLVSYELELIPTPEDDLRVVLSENPGMPRFAVEGRVALKALLYPSEPKKDDLDEMERKKLKKKKKKELKHSIILDEAPVSDSRNSDGLMAAPLEDETRAKTERRIRGDKEVVKDEMFALMQSRRQWTKTELVEKLNQPMSLIDELLTEWCEKVEPSSESFRRSKAVYQLKSYLVSSNVSSSASEQSYQPPAKRPAP